MDKKHRDCNNTWKCMLDAITETELVWKDDDIVCERVNKIVYDADNPRVELYIHYVEYVGIFDNEDQLETFKNDNCIGCKRYKRNCTLLRNAIEGRVQEEIDGYICNHKENISVFTGGDAFYFAEKMKSAIFVTPNLVLMGLAQIADYYASK